MSQAELIKFKQPFQTEQGETHQLLCCMACEKFIAIALDDADKPVCPLCGGYGQWVDEGDEAVTKVCERDKCSMYGKFVENQECQGTFNNHPCKRKTTEIDADSAWGRAQMQADAGGTIVGLSHLLAQIKKANQWTTSHHKDKSGPHSASARATHAKGDQQDASQKQNFIKFIEAAMTVVKEDLDEAEKMPPEVEDAFDSARKAIERLERM
jgi:hypothetical protein